MYEIVPLEFELIYYNMAVKHVNHYAMEIPSYLFKIIFKDHFKRFL